MPEINDVVRGLELCTIPGTGPCDDCPYFGELCQMRLGQDAIALLKATQAREANTKIKVWNVEEGAMNYPWMVIRVVDGRAWYFASWKEENLEKAIKCALEEGGTVIPSSAVEVVEW